MIMEAGKSKACCPAQVHRPEAAVEPGRADIQSGGCQAEVSSLNWKRVNIVFYLEFQLIG